MLALAAYPCRYIPVSPIPKGWLPRIGKPPRYPFLYPDEDAKLLACKDVPLVNRVLYGLLAREGTRGPSEALAIPIHRIDFVHGTYGLGDNKTDDPRGWVLSEGVAKALQIRVEHFDPKPELDALLFLDPRRRSRPRTAGHLARKFREHLRLAGVVRPELFENSDFFVVRFRAQRFSGHLHHLGLGAREVGAVGDGLDGSHHERDAPAVPSGSEDGRGGEDDDARPLDLAIPEFAPFLAKPETPLPEAVDATRAPSPRTSGLPSEVPSLPN